MVDEEALRQLSYLSSLLAGFGVMVTVGLLSLKDERKIISWVIGVMLLASLLFLTSTSIGAMYFMVPSDWISFLPSEVPDPEEFGFNFLDTVAVTIAAFTYIGTLAFSLGVALLGWIRSTLVGWISTISALLFVLVFNIIVAAVSLTIFSALP
ncbi:MAG: hypothetical protein JSV69_00230 [Chloroflexota bacterium]|nr:MAG: hypothetical protein JSV69_00230 [Chloroflexota bacterium]